MKYFHVLALAGMMIILGCKQYKPLEVGDPENLKLKALSGNSLEVTIHLPIRNPNLYSIKVTKLEGSAYINDQKAGKIHSSEKIKLPARSDKIHEVPLEIDYSDLLSSGISLMKVLQTRQVDLTLKGTLTAQSFLYKKDFHFNRKKTVRLER